jgi:hypothetical protein
MHEMIVVSGTLGGDDVDILHEEIKHLTAL